MKLELFIYRILIGILFAILIIQGTNIKDLQKKTDYLFDEVYFVGGLLHSIETDLDYHIEKCEVQE